MALRARRVKAVGLLLDGKPFAQEGDRYPLIRDIGNQIAIREPFTAPGILAEIFRESLTAMAAANPNAPDRNMDDAVALIEKAQSRAQDKFHEAADQKNNFLAALTRTIWRPHA